jgi:hypothetical protein
MMGLHADAYGSQVIPVTKACEAWFVYLRYYYLRIFWTKV